MSTAKFYPTATLVRVESVKGTTGRTYVFKCRCDSCGQTVRHGGGSDRALVSIFLGHRVSHCRCDLSSVRGYFLIDPDGIA